MNVLFIPHMIHGLNCYCCSRMTLNMGLHHAIRERKWDQVTRFVQQGADVNLRDKRTGIPFHEAVKDRDVPLDVVTQLISPQNINTLGRDNSTALHLVIQHKRWDLVPVLVQHGADVNLCYWQNNTPLH